MKIYTLTDGDYWDGENEWFVIYFPCKITTISARLKIEDKESGNPCLWDCFLSRLKLVDAHDRNGDYIQKYRCIYKKY